MGTQATGTTPSSGMPSQSLSRPSQVSVAGALEQVPKPPPGTQVPMGTATGALQAS